MIRASSPYGLHVGALRMVDLVQGGRKRASTICMVTHDTQYAEHAQREIHLFDGRMGA